MTCDRSRARTADFLLLACVHWLTAILLTLHTGSFTSLLCCHCTSQTYMSVHLSHATWKFSAGLCSCFRTLPKEGPYSQTRIFIPLLAHVLPQAFLAGRVLAWALLDMECVVMEKPVPWKGGRAGLGPQVIDRLWSLTLEHRMAFKHKNMWVETPY